MTAVQDDLTEALLGGSEDTVEAEPDLFGKLHADNQKLIAEADGLLSRLDSLGPKIEQRIAQEVAHARSELIKQVRAQVLSKTTAELGRELLGTFWRD